MTAQNYEVETATSDEDEDDNLQGFRGVATIEATEAGASPKIFN